MVSNFAPRGASVVVELVFGTAGPTVTLSRDDKYFARRFRPWWCACASQAFARTLVENGIMLPFCLINVIGDFL